MSKSLIARAFDAMLERAFRIAFQRGYELGHNEGWMLHLEYTETGRLNTLYRPSVVAHDSPVTSDAWTTYRAEFLDELY